MNVCVVFFDLKNAFDSVPHRLLLLKPSTLGIGPYLVRWIASYDNRQAMLKGAL